MKYSLSLAIAGAVVLAGQAKADLSYTETADYAAIPPTQTISLPAFNGSLGLLTGVSFTLSSTDSIYAEIYNTAGINQPYTTATVSLPVTISGAPASLTTTTTGTANYTAGTVTPGLNLLTTQTTTVSSTSSVLTTGLSAFENGGTYSLSLNTGTASYSGTTPSGITTLLFGGAGTSIGSVTVTYDYVNTPEPSSLLGGFGALSTMAMLVWRKRKQ